MVQTLENEIKLLTRNIDTELSEFDNGDDMQRRLEYQAAFAASKAIEMLKPENEIDCMYCELHQDLLVRLTSKKFIVIQVKTRVLPLTSFLATDEEIISTIANFLRLQRQYPKQIKRFVLASNHGFRKENKANCLPDLIALATFQPTNLTIEDLHDYLAKANKADGTDYSVQELTEVLSNLYLDGEQPHFKDFPTVLARQIANSVPFASEATQVELIDAAEVLIGKMRSLGSLQVERGFDSFIKQDPHAFDQQQKIQSKVALPDTVMAILKNKLVNALKRFDSKSNGNSSLANTETPSKTIEEINSIFEKQSNRLLSWPTTIDGEVRLECKELDILKNSINTRESSVQLLLGPPGAGKSALMAVLAKSLKNQNEIVIALKADQMNASIDETAKLKSLLGLDHSLQAEIEKIAVTSKIIIILDQLDSLADLACLTTARLDMYMEMIETLAGCRNVHIIATSRTFEADHDPRLRHLDAVRVTLELPKWEDVASYLATKSIHSDAWPPDVKELLRTPQFLKIFTALHNSGSQNIENTYRGLLNSLWTLHVDNEGGKEETLLEAIAERMSTNEELSVPSAAYASERKLLKKLIAAGILLEDVTVGSLAFSHQTLFEYARARMFLKGFKSLAEYTIERQTSMFIRPQLWNALNYLRDGSITQYRQELDLLLTRGNLRFHVLVLIIEFLGNISEPEDFEVEWLIPYLSQERFRKITFNAVRNSRGWFKKLKESYLPTYLQEQSSDGVDAEIVLRAATAFDGEAVFELLSQSWLTRIDRDFASLQILEKLEYWPESVHKAICLIVRRNELHPFYISQLCSNQARTAPKQAIELLLAELQGKEERAFQLEEKNLESLDDLKSESFKEIRRSLECPRRKAVIQILDGDCPYDIEKIWERAPEQFVQTIWPWFHKLLSNILHNHSKDESEYVSDGSNSILDDDESSSNSIVMMMDTAISKFAEKSPELFLNFLEENQKSPSLLVQRMLTRGLIKIAADNQLQSWAYLLGDKRRLALSDHHSDHSETIELISCLIEGATRENVEKLCIYISEYDYYSVTEEVSQQDDIELRFDRNKWNRQHRLALLRAIPDRFCSEKIVRFKQEENRVFPESNVDKKYGKVTRIESPMTIAQMSKASAEQLAGLFEELPDHSGSRHPKDSNKGGSSYASNNLRELAKTDPGKVISLVEQLKPILNEIPAGEAVIGLCASQTESETIFNVIRSMIARGFESISFKIAVCDGIHTVAGKAIEIPTDFVVYLETFLATYRGGEPITISRPSNTERRSILWSSISGEGYSHDCTYKVVSTLSKIYLSNGTLDWSKWLELLESLSKKTELRDFNQTWRMLAIRELPWLANVDQNRAAALLENLISLHKSPLLSWAGAQLFAATHFWLPENTVRIWLHSFSHGDWEDSKQAYGELLLIHHLNFPHRKWAKQLIDGILTDNTKIEDVQIVHGVAFATGHQWTATVPHLNEYISRLLKISYTDVRLALAEGLSNKELLTNIASRDFLEMLCEDYALLKKVDAFTLLDNCLHVISWYPEQVYKICILIVQLYGEEIRDLRTSKIELASPLVDIAIRLQRLKEPAREHGLELFELLIHHDVPDAKVLLSALDRRIESSSGVSPIRLPRRRRNRSRSV